MIWPEAGGHTDDADAYSEGDLKICDLCGALNLANNGTCFVCGWHGRFERRPEVVRIAMDLLKRRHGAIKAQFLTDGGTCRLATAHTLRAAMMRAFGRIRFWLFG